MPDKDETGQGGSEEPEELSAAEAGAIVGERIAHNIDPSNAVLKKAGQILGRVVGRRLDRGHPIFAIGTDIVSQAMVEQRIDRSKKRRKAFRGKKKKASTKALEKRRSKEKKA